MEKKNTILLTIIAVATLLVAVVGATFAYFTAQNGASGSTTATVTTETIGAITVSNEDPALYLDLTAAQMQEGVTGSYWATKTKGAEPATNYASADKAVIAKLNVSGGGEETVYSCNFKITVDKTDVTLAYGDAAVVFALENNAEILGVTTGREIDYTTLLNEYTVNFTRVGDTEEDLPLVSVSMRVSNTEVEQGFAGETLTTTFTSSDLECEVVDESDVKTLSGTWRFNDELTAPSWNGNANQGSSPVGSLCNFSVGGTDYASIAVAPLSESYTDSGYAVNVYALFVGNETATNGIFIYSNDTYVNAGLSAGWQSEAYKTITFTSEQEISDEFYEWFIANAKPVIEVYELPTENIDTNVIYKTYEYTDVDSSDTTTIKAGTYRFNDVLVDTPEGYQTLRQEINFTTRGVDAEYGIDTLATCDGIMAGDHSIDGVEVYYNVLSFVPSVAGFNVGDNAVYRDIWYVQSIKEITIPEDSEVSDEFGVWFAANAKLRGDNKYYQYIDGTWVEQ